MAEQAGEHMEESDAAQPAAGLVIHRVFPADPGASSENRDRLFRLAYRFLWNREDAEDVVQEALASAYQQWMALRDEDKWWPWMCRIVVNRCRAQGRTRKRIRTRDQEMQTAARSVEHGEASEAVDRAVLKRQLQDALLRLPRRQREVVVLRHLEQMEYSRIAEILGLSPETVRGQARNGLERLQQLMRANGGERFSRLANAGT